jgi:hypothetical protein
MHNGTEDVGRPRLCWKSLPPQLSPEPKEISPDMLEATAPLHSEYTSLLSQQLGLACSLNSWDWQIPQQEAFNVLVSKASHQA